MKTWLLVDHEGEPRDRWESREMPITEAFFRAGRSPQNLKVWLHREGDGLYEAAIGTEEEVTELWPRGATLAEVAREERT